MITYMNASRRDMENLMSTRLEMLREVNNLSEDYTFPDNLHFALFGGRKCVLERSLCGA